jgi:glucokinase
MILAGDIGASNSRLGIFRSENGSLHSERTAKFRNKDFSSIYEILDRFLDQKSEVNGACFGVAGPVLNGVAELTNNGWTIEARLIESRLGAAPVWLINDVEATGYGLSRVTDQDLLTLNRGTKDNASPAALIASGTGLGESILLRNGVGYVPIAGEWGHADFAPNDDLEMDFLTYMRTRFGHVSNDRVLSGPGLVLMYEFLRDAMHIPANDAVSEQIEHGDAGEVITRNALEGRCELCSRALDMFVKIYGAESGNLALRSLARGGIYLGGGIAPKIRTKLTDGTFMNAFTSKGRMQPLLEAIPVHVVLNDQTGLLGAAHYATIKSKSAH